MANRSMVRSALVRIVMLISLTTASTTNFDH